MDRMRDHSATIVEQALLVSQELIRVAILWHELWHEGLEEASRLYYTEKNPEGMIAILEPLHELLEAVRPLSRCVIEKVSLTVLLGSNNNSRNVFCSSIWSRSS